MITTNEAIRLLRNIVGEPHDDPRRHFDHAIRDGLVLTPELDLQDITTLGRLWAGEGITDRDDGSVR